VSSTEPAPGLSAKAQQIERSANKKLCVYHAHDVAFSATS
jgi:hypothetical protein